MANGSNTTPTITTTPTPATGTESKSYLDTIRKQAAATRDVGAPDISRQAELATQGLRGSAVGQAGAAIQQYGQDVKTTQKQAEKAATGLEVAGEATGRYMENLEAIQGRLTTQVESSKNSWGEAAEKADEYVSAARGRVGEVLGKIDEINSQIAKDRDFSKAHAMQASVQASLGTMKAEERNIMETYGTESKEYQQFTESKRTALATVQSNIHATYQQLAEQQGQTFLNATADAMTKSNMYLGFQEQQHVEMLKFKEQSKNAYDLQVAQFQVGVEQLKMSGMENLANWIIETPTFSMDATPLITLIGDLASTQRAEDMARAAMAPELERQRIQNAITRQNLSTHSGGRRALGSLGR